MLPFDRQSLRLPSFDYSRPGAYFTTIVTQNRHCLFGEIRGSMELNEAGQMIERTWLDLPARFACITLDAWIVMPNHFHGIVLLSEWRSSPVRLTEVIGAFKSISTVEYSRGVHERGWQSFGGKLWERSFHERGIRDERSLLLIRAYIANNVAAWIRAPNLV